VTPTEGTIEFHALPVPLDQLLPGTNRNPIVTVPLPIQPTPIQPGCPTRIPLPQAPPTAQYAVIILNLSDAQGQPSTMDFMLLPLDSALRPTMETGGIRDSFFDVFVDFMPARLYRVRESPTLDSFFDVFTELSLEEGGQMNLRLPVSGMQKFFQIGLDPE
jgi:hypothetical protein